MQIRLMETQPLPIYAVDARSHLPPRHARRAALAGVPPDRGARRRPRHHDGRPDGHRSRRSSTRCSVTTCARASCRRSSRSPSRRPSSRSRARSAPTVAACARTPGGSSSAAAASSTPTCSTAVGIDPEEYSGFAFGFGIDRIPMMRYEIDNIQTLLWENDVRFLRQF